MSLMGSLLKLAIFSVILGLVVVLASMGFYKLAHNYIPLDWLLPKTQGMVLLYCAVLSVALPMGTLYLLNWIAERINRKELLKKSMKEEV